MTIVEMNRKLDRMNKDLVYHTREQVECQEVNAQDEMAEHGATIWRIKKDIRSLENKRANLINNEVKAVGFHNRGVFGMALRNRR